MKKYSSQEQLLKRLSKSIIGLSDSQYVNHLSNKLGLNMTAIMN